MDIKIRSDGDLREALEEEAKSIEGKLTQATGAAGLALQARMRSETRARLGGNAAGIANAWRIDLYPGSRKGSPSGVIQSGQTSASPAVVVWTKAPKVISAFTDGVVIRAKNGRFLAIPSDNVPKRIAGNKRPTPDLLAAAGYDLEYVESRAGERFIVGKLRTGRTGRRSLSRRTSGEGDWAVMFFLVPVVRPPRLFDLDAQADRAVVDLASRIDQALAT